MRRKERRGPRGTFSTSSKPSMAYLVKITSRAERDLAELYGKIDAEHSDAALEWYRGLKEAILSLEERPHRCPVTRRKDALRHLLYGHKPHVDRVIYRVLKRSKRVEILHIPHGARRRLKPSDLA
jgi:plasmid stabilization system protein ParE